MSSFPRDPEATFKLRGDLDPEVVGEEIAILGRMSDAVTERVGPDATSEERVAAADELIEEDPEMGDLAARLRELMRSNNDKSVARGLISLGLEEVEAEEEEELHLAPNAS